MDQQLLMRWYQPNIHVEMFQLAHTDTSYSEGI